MNEKKKYIWSVLGRIALVIAIVGIIALGAYLLLTKCVNLSELKDKLGDSFWFWLIVGVLNLMQTIFLPISNQVITIPVALLDTSPEWKLKVWLVSLVSIWIGTIILFFIGRHGGGKLLQWLLKDKDQVEHCKTFLNKGKVFYPLMMISVFPDDLTTILAGVGGMSFTFVAICSLITRAIDIFCTVFVLSYLALTWWGILLLVVFYITLTIISFNLFKKQK